MLLGLESNSETKNSASSPHVSDGGGAGTSGNTWVRREAAGLERERDERAGRVKEMWAAEGMRPTKPSIFLFSF